MNEDDSSKLDFTMLEKPREGSSYMTSKRVGSSGGPTQKSNNLLKANYIADEWIHTLQ